MSDPLLLLSIGAARLRTPTMRARVQAAAIEAIRARTGLAPEVAETLDAGQATLAIAAAVARGADLIVVAGGDGSVRTAALAIAGSGASLGIVPAGTGNLLAAAVGLPRDPIAAARRIAELPVRRLDMGRVTTSGETSGFVVAAGIGFDARVMAATTAESKIRFGLAAYFAAAIRVAASVRGSAMRIVADGAAYEIQGLGALVANAGELIPGLLGPRDPIRPDDGLLDVFAVAGAAAPDGLLASLSLLLQRPLASGTAVAVGHGSLRIRARAVSIMTDPPEPIEVDGDLVAETTGRLDAEIRPGALPILAPTRRDPGRGRTDGPPMQPGPVLLP